MGKDASLTMKIYLAATESIRPILLRIEKERGDWRQIPMLQSYWSLRNKAQAPAFPENVMIDSGAFTFIQSKGRQKIDWERYVDEYAAYVVAHKIRLFFELDIDPIIGYDRVLRLRERLEKAAGRPSIPVWHKSRGKEDYIALCNSGYKYISIGGIVSGEITRRDFAHLPWFIEKAHERGVKIHGLGMTSTTLFAKCHFDSVDSSTWIVGAKYGNLCEFRDGQMHQRHFDGKRCRDVDALQFYNFRQWVAFGRYAQTHY